MGTMTNEYTDLHELAKGWKAAIARATDPATKYVSSFFCHCFRYLFVVLDCAIILCNSHFCFTFSYRHEAQIKNDRGNLPLHSATSFRAPLEVAGELVRTVCCCCCCLKFILLPP